MAQMPIQLVSSRVQPTGAASAAAFTAKPKVEIPRNAYLYDTSGISGGLLRPGAVDQQLFKAYMTAAQKEAVLAPASTSKAPAFSGIPSLSPAQLAALGVDVGEAVEAPSEGELTIDIPSTNPADPASGTRVQPGGIPGGIEGGIEGGTGRSAAPLIPATPGGSLMLGASATADAALAATASDSTMPDSAMPDSTMPAATAADPNAAPVPDLSPAAGPAPQASAERSWIPNARRGTDGAWELTRLPDKDEREMLYGQKWRVVESEQSRKLFLGPDGEFGWDDFVDLINPLQHIPLVNMAYRAITGDEIYGAARMADFAFGPVAGVSTALDLGFRDLTGESMASNAVAALFGPGEAPAGGQPAGDVSVNTASADGTQHGAPAIRRGSNQ
ncbi:MAG TPA: hypothetical protein VGQ35_21155 [Dongiaceae bacterium]|nr:hypothetical protein [Dongiaceae bacterium]